MARSYREVTECLGPCGRHAVHRLLGHVVQGAIEPRSLAERVDEPRGRPLEGTESVAEDEAAEAEVGRRAGLEVPPQDQEGDPLGRQAAPLDTPEDAAQRAPA